MAKHRELIPALEVAIFPGLPWNRPAKTSSSTTTERYSDPLAETDIPDATSQIPVPLLIGRRRITRPNTIWTNTPESVRTVVRTEDTKGSFGGSIKYKNNGKRGTSSPVTTTDRVLNEPPKKPEPKVTETVTVTTTVDFAVALCLGPEVVLMGVYDANDNVLFEVSDPIDDGLVTGQELALSAYCDGMTFYGGDWDQGRDPTMVASDGANLTPAYRGTSYAVFKNAKVDDSNVIYALSFECVRVVDWLSLPIDALYGPQYDANPINGVIEALCSLWGGAKVNFSFIDTDSFYEAALTVASEGLWASALISTRTAVKAVIASFLDMCNGCMRWNPRIAKLQIVLFREDYVIELLPHFTQDNVAALTNLSKTTWYTTPKVYNLQYIDRANNYSQETFVIGVDLAAAEKTDNPITARFDFVTYTDVALRVGVPNYAKLVAPVLSMEMQTNRDIGEHMPGDVIKVSWPYINGLIEFPLRINKIRENGTGNKFDTFSVDLDQATFAFTNTKYAGGASLAGPTTELPTTPSAVTDTIPLPYYFMLQRGAQFAGSYDENSDVSLHVILTPDDPEDGTRTFVAMMINDEMNADITLVDGGVRPLMGYLSAPIAVDDGYSNGLIDIDFYGMSYDSELIPAPRRNLGQGVLMIGNEFFVYSSALVVNGVGTFTDVRRGMFDSVAMAHAVDDRILVFQDFSAVSQYAINNATSATLARLYGLAGFKLAPESEAVPFDITNMSERLKLPACPHNGQVSIYEEGVHSPYGRGDIGVTPGQEYWLGWRRRDRLAGTYSYRSEEQTPTEPTTYNIRIQQGATSVNLLTGVDGITTPFTVPGSFVTGTAQIFIRAVSANGQSLYEEFVNLIVN